MILFKFKTFASDSQPNIEANLLVYVTTLFMKLTIKLGLNIYNENIVFNRNTST